MATYSLDLRKRVMDAISKGTRPTVVAKTFDISRTAVYDWKNLLKKQIALSQNLAFKRS